MKLRNWARTIRRDVLTLWIAARDSRTPWYAKLMAAAVAGYALSPIDLIPDFIPVVGYLDDMVIVPLGILLTVQMIPTHLIQEYREKAIAVEARPVSNIAVAFVVILWLAGAVWLARWLAEAL